MEFRFAPGSSKLVGVCRVGDDPKRQTSLRSSMDPDESFTHGDKAPSSAFVDPSWRV